MTVKTKFSHKLLSAFLCLALLVTYLPFSLLKVDAASGDTVGITADSSTMDDWKKFFPITGNITTENAGGIWTDKSVFTNDDAFSDITMTETDNFLVALSAMGSNMTVTGMSSVPTDTMLVLDISDSMSQEANELVSAANDTIKTLLASNKYSRVGVVLYSGPSGFTASDGSHATVILPLGRYTTSDSNGRFLNYSNDVISLNTSVLYEGTTSRPTYRSRQVIGGTYIQLGVKLALDQFVASSNQTTVVDPTIGTVTRKPIMVLMSDGAPTLATTDFTAPAVSTSGNGGSTSAGRGFMTQLTMSYAKAKMEEKYETKALFYTLAIGLSSRMNTADNPNMYEIARAVLDPSNTYNDSSALALKGLWDLYNEAEIGDSINTENGDVIKSEMAMKEEFVDMNFSASGAGDLADTFRRIVNEISLQSKYFPTLVQGSEDLSGYVSFVDKIGKYMEVKKVEGIRLHRTLFSGKELAQNFVAGGGLLGTFGNASALGNELVNAVMTRLSITDDQIARDLIRLAYQHGQLSYTSETEFSNYIGWYSDANGKYVGFWYEGIDPSTKPSDAVYSVKSYCYLGETDDAQGVSDSDMMYAVVQVRKEIATGEETVVFSVPAALLPTVSYEVALNESGDLSALDVSGATAPIRLVYKVGLRDGINEFTVNDLVDSTYISENTENGVLSFYSNQFEADGTTGYQKKNTYSYFRPSRDNDRYYYQNPSLVYSDNSGTVYSGTSAPTGTKYHAYNVYTKNGSLATETVYHVLTAEGLATATANGDGTWSVPAGIVRRDYAGYTVPKTPNVTGTLDYLAVPYQDIEGHTVDDLEHSFVVGATLGNNGKLTITPETGIKITKTLAAGVNSTSDYFEFIVSGATDGSHPAYKIGTDGSASDTTVTFSGGSARVTLKAGETLYIGGMTAGQQITVTETATEKYTVQSVNGKVGTSDTVTVAAGDFADVAFINTLRGTGNFTIAKDIIHPLGTNYTVPVGKKFTMRVKLTLNGWELDGREFTAKQTKDSTVTKITTDIQGMFEISLSDDDQLELYGLPEGAVVTVEEVNPGTGFTKEYWDNGTKGDGVVTVEAERTVSVVVVNTYTPEEVKSNIITLTVDKALTGRDWNSTDEFEFVLQKWNGTDWVNVGQPKKVTSSAKSLNFNTEIQAEEYSAVGTYYYRVAENEPDDPILGVSYDKAIHGFVVEVTDADMDGKLEVSAVRKADSSLESSVSVTGDSTNGFNVATSFTNVFNTNEANASIEIHKTVDNASESNLATLNGFIFEIYESDKDGNVGDKLAATLQPAATTTTGTARATLQFTQADYDAVSNHTYYYAIKETDGGKTGWTYSTDVKYVTVVLSHVDDGNGGAVLVATAYSGLGVTGIGSTIATVTFTNVYTPVKAELPISFVNKVLNGRALNDGEFTFKITAVNTSTVTSPLVDKDGLAITEILGTNNAAGEVIFTQPLYFDKVGTYFYNISEESGTKGGVAYDKNTYRMTVTVSDVGGALKAECQIINAQGEEVTFVNTYTPNPIPNAISGTKKLTGRSLLNDEFTFVLSEAVDANGTLKENGLRLTANNSVSGSLTEGIFTFSEIEYTAAGTYYYVITEQGPSGTETYGIEYSSEKYVVTVIIADDGNGNLRVESVSHTEEELVFVNEYRADPTTAVILGNKVLNGRVLGAEEFSFELYKSDSAWNTYDKLETVKNAADGTFSFEELDFDTAGTHYYLVKEVKGDKGGITYDETVFRVRIEIKDDLKGNLIPSVYIFDGENVPRSGVIFVNEYAVTGTESVKLEGNKTLTGRDIVDGEFTFELYETNGEYAVSEGQAPALSVQNEGAKFEFELTYKPEDIGSTFYYVVKEANAGKTIDGVTYSSAEYHVSVEVLDDGLGGIKTVVTVVGGGTVGFVNTYEAADSTVTLGGDKVLTGRELIDGEFKFVLYETNGEYEIKAGQTPLTATNKNGKFEFEKLTFDTVGTYFFVISEDVTVNAERITFDTAKYYITVTVTDNGEGNLVASYKIKTSPDAENTVDNIKFTNVYTPKPADITVDVNIDKKVENKGTETMSPEGFEFLLVKDGTDEKLTVKTGADGKAKFILAFTENDIGKTYTYKLTEVDGKLENVKYSKAEYVITVTVTLNGENELVADLTLNEIAVETVKAEFVNEYDYTPPIDDIPQTGDTSDLRLWTFVLLVSGAGLIGTSVLGKKKKENENA